MGKGTQGQQKLHTGPCFTPRLPEGQRPEYPSFGNFVLWSGLVPTLQAGFWTVFLALLCSRPYQHSVAYWQRKHWTERAHTTAVLCTMTTSLYFGYNSLFVAFERYGLFSQYKIGRTSGQQKTTALQLPGTLKKALLGKLMVTPLLTWFVMYPLMKHFGMPSFDAPIPGVPELFVQFVIAYWWNETLFYWSHRLLHDKRLYAAFHKEHHTYTGTVGFAAEHAGLVEQILSNYVPSLGGCIVFGRHPFVLLVWIMIRLFNTYDGHSGYSFNGTFVQRIGLMQCTAYHDYHHSYSFRGNFGHPLLDYLFGTMDFWVADGGSAGYFENQKKLEARRKKCE